MDGINRRQLLKTAAFTAGSLALFNFSAVNAASDSLLKKSTLPPLNADVLVVGAGPSGIPAAIAAARQGARVILIEEDFVPGGAPVNMYVSMLCGGPRLGIYREMAEKLNANYELSGQPVPEFNDGLKNGWNFWYLPSSYVSVLSDMIAAEKNIKLICGARAVNTLVEDIGNRNRVKGISVDLGGATQTIEAALTIDATGTGLVAEMAGCKIRYGRESKYEFNEPFGPEKADNRVQRCTWMYISQRVRKDAVLPFEKLGRGKGGRTGAVENHVDHWVGINFKGKQDEYQKRNTGIYLHWGSTVECENTRDPVAIAEAMQKALPVIQNDIAVLNANGYAMHLAPKIGIRECRRVEGEYIITVNDLKSGKLPDDVVAISDYGIDAWGEKVKDEDIICPRSGIPYRALIPKNTDGLLIAGKSISGTHFAASSYRVQPTVASIGQAAGTAAAMAVSKKNNVRSIEIKDLQKSLRQQGTLL